MLNTFLMIPVQILKIIWRKSNINDFVCLNEVFTGITKVYHCAGFISFSIDDNHKLYEINKRGTENIVNLCIEKKNIKISVHKFNFCIRRRSK